MNGMSPGTDFNMYQKVTSKTKSYVPIASMQHVNPFAELNRIVLAQGKQRSRAKQMPDKNVNKIFTTNMKLPRPLPRLGQYMQSRNKLYLSTGRELAMEAAKVKKAMK